MKDADLELFVSSEEILIFNLEYIKNLLNRAINLEDVKKIVTTNYCYFCDDTVNNKIEIDFIKGEIKELVHNCSFGNKFENKYTFELGDKYLRTAIRNSDCGNYVYLGMSFGIIEISLSDFYQKKEYELYGKSIYSGHEEKLVFRINEEDEKMD